MFRKLKKIWMFVKLTVGDLGFCVKQSRAIICYGCFPPSYNAKTIVRMFRNAFGKNLVQSYRLVKYEYNP